MAKIHILALDATRKGGAGVYTLGLVKTLALRGHHVTLVCHEAVDEVKRIANVVELPRINSQRRYGLWRFSSWLQLVSYSKLVKSIKLPTPDVVIGSAQPIALAFLKNYPGLPFIYLPHSLIAPLEISSYRHGGTIQNFASVSAYWFMEMRCFNLADLTIRFSKSACIESKEYYGKSIRGQLVALPMPMKIQEERAKMSVGKIVRLLFVGRLIPSKNVLFLLKALAKISAENWTLSVVGDGDDKEALIDFVERSGLESKVVFHGHVDDPTDFYLAADLFVFPSLLESYGIVLLEAMSFSLPTLSFRSDGKNYIGVAEEFIVDGQDGFLARNEKEFIQILERAINRKYDLHQLGRAAYSSLIKNNSWESHAVKLEEVIQSLIK